MQRGTVVGFLLGLISGKKENTPINNAISITAGNMLARDLRDMTEITSPEETYSFVIARSAKGLAPGAKVAVPSEGSLYRDIVGEYVGIEEYDSERVVIIINGEYHSYCEVMVQAL